MYPYHDGFAIITRVEKREKDGHPSIDRWANMNEIPLPIANIFSAEYLQRLFVGREGMFRFFIFTFTSGSPALSSTETNPAEASEWQTRGPVSISDNLKNMEIRYPFVFSVMIYEFNAVGNRTLFVEPNHRHR